MRRPTIRMRIGLVRMNRLHLRNVSDIVGVPCRSRSMRDTMRWSNRVAVGRSNAMRCTGAMDLVATGVVAVMSPAVAARKAEERHRGHAGGAEYQAEDVEVHFVLDVARVASPAQSRGNLSPQIGVQQGAITRTQFAPPPTHFRCQL